MAILSERTWSRHANPWSGWTRVLAMPMLGLGLYFHNWWLLGLTLLWTIINPVIFSAPKRVDNWMSRGVLGEQQYYSDKKYIKRDLPTLLNIINVVLGGLFVYVSWQQMLNEAILLGILVMVVKFWFVDRMAHLRNFDGSVR